MILNTLKSNKIAYPKHRESLAYLCACLLLTLLCYPQNISLAQNISENAARGPIELRDVFPIGFGRLNYSPKSTKLENIASINLHWANTENTNGPSYLIDAETRELALGIKKIVDNNLELSLSLPIFWQGGGILDSLIFNWHELFNLPQGPRALTDTNGFNVGADNFELDSSGVKIGDIRTAIKYLVSKGSNQLPAISTSLELRLPTGSNFFSPGSFDLILDFVLSKRILSEKIDSLFIYSGLYYSYFDNAFFNQINFEKNRYGGFISLEYAYSNKLSFLLTSTANSNLTEDILNFPNHLVYVDLGLKYGLNQNLELVFNIRENATPSKGSSDFSSFFGLNYFY